jgi:molybdate transport system substrate-binding protein
MTLHVLSAGAAKGLVSDLTEAFTAETGVGIDGAFNAVGAIKEKFLAGDACDVLILTDGLIRELTRQGSLVADSGAPLGVVRTGIAVPSGRPAPDISSADALRATLLASKGIYVPDLLHSTAGGHFLTILRRMGIDLKVEPSLRAFPNGATAMRHLAQAGEENAIGCTQVTEIKYTQGLEFAGALPQEFELATVYAAAVNRRSANLEAAHRFVALLTGAASQDLRIQSGFEAG